MRVWSFTSSGVLALVGALMLAIGVPSSAGAQPAESLREAVERIEPAVVAILSVDARGDANQGTGFIVRADGLLVTCAHVVKDAATIEIHWSNSLERPSETATVVSSSSEHDLALLQLTGYNYPVLPLAAADALRVGDSVAAVGFPVGDILGLTDLTVTRGIVSALRRDAAGALELVQTDTPITVGNSGGPLYDLDLGGVIGVVRAKGIEELNGINFAAALDTLLEVFPEVTSEVTNQITSTRASAVLLGGTGKDTSALPELFSTRKMRDIRRFVQQVEDTTVPADSPHLYRHLTAGELAEFLAAYPAHAQGHYLAGAAAEAEGDTAVAAQHFHAAWWLNPQDGLSAAAMARLSATTGDEADAALWSERAWAVGWRPEPDTQE